MHWVFEPHQGTDRLAFGTRRAETRELLSPLQFVTKATEPENDFYTKDGAILGYDEDNELEFIEVFRPASASFSGIHFFELDLSEVLARMLNLGLSSVFRYGSYKFTSVGIAMYCPNQTLESVSVYRDGYYDEV